MTMWMVPGLRSLRLLRTRWTRFALLVVGSVSFNDAPFPTFPILFKLFEAILVSKIMPNTALPSIC